MSQRFVLNERSNNQLEIAPNCPFLALNPLLQKNIFFQFHNPSKVPPVQTVRLAAACHVVPR